MSMTNKQLKEILNQYPDESLIFIHDNENKEHIETVNIKYFNSDDYSTPDIILF